MRERIGAVCAFVLLASCTTLRAPTESELARVLAAGGVAATAGTTTAEVTIRSERLTGTFAAVLASEPGGRVRLQLFPDVGGKILDLYADSTRVLGTIPQGGIRVEGPAGPDLPRHVLVFFALTLLEHSTPITRARILGVRRDGDLLLVALAPRVPGCGVEAEVRSDGTLVGRRFGFRHVSWHEELGPEVRVTGPGFRLVATSGERTTLDESERAAAFSHLP